MELKQNWSDRPMPVDGRKGLEAEVYFDTMHWMWDTGLWDRMAPEIKTEIVKARLRWEKAAVTGELEPLPPFEGVAYALPMTGRVPSSEISALIEARGR